jgi:hypothetical protein
MCFKEPDNGSDPLSNIRNASKYQFDTATGASYRLRLHNLRGTVGIRRLSTCMTHICDIEEESN